MFKNAFFNDRNGFNVFHPQGGGGKPHEGRGKETREESKEITKGYDNKSNRRPFNFLSYQRAFLCNFLS